ncbi:MAG: hypothetical protein FWG64_05510 [Firmicutes bacterium]|nr:hypothetical protein [Bacillota bacterium]
MQQFHREYKLAFGSGEIGTLVTARLPDGQANEKNHALRISFNIQKNDDEQPDTAKISLWNLSPQNIATLNEDDCVVTLHAGYRGEFLPMIFKGIVTYTETIDNEADHETYFEAQDCRVELRDTYVSLSYAETVNTRQIITDIAAQMGLAPNISHNAEFHDIPKGYSYIGPARMALDSACASSALRWRAETDQSGGILHIKKNRDSSKQEVYVLSAESGLIGTPKKITYGGDTEGTAMQTGWEVEYFLNGEIGISDFVKLDSRKISGYFRVKTIDMTGDNIEGDWLCKATLLEN